MSTSDYNGNPIAYLSAFEGKLEPLRAQEELTLLKPDLAALYTTDRAAFALAADLIKEKLGIYPPRPRCVGQAPGEHSRGRRRGAS